MIDTWRTSGMRGTGSNDVCLTDVRIPFSHRLSLTGDAPVMKGALFRFPVFGLLAAGIAAVASGNARAGLAHLATHLGEKPLPGGRTLADKGTVQAAFAEAFARHAGARAFYLSEIAEAEVEAGKGSHLCLEQRARLRLAATHLTQESAATLRVLHRLAGGEAVFEDHELNQCLADAEVMTAHIMTAPATLELTGRALLRRPVSSLEI
jgi:alkylation response protein AidB-like acyl-CoA dehydrogenase